ncbi:histone deacetylase 8 [Dorcoceras hygrometricum]|uniref:Histone deacetylase 8 n=1 Tax=Dorcoceras hygrometricum TaxID=472368 RepID=A0A2Z7D294_9LAMI|nr:histone deacetylase 8 [Dorcoceras hygrometricum]
MEGYRIVRGVANKYCDGRILIVQEGGYHVTYSAYCLHATLEGVLLIPIPLLSDPIAYYPEGESLAILAIESMKEYHQQFVPFLK